MGVQVQVCDHGTARMRPGPPAHDDVPACQRPPCPLPPGHTPASPAVARKHMLARKSGDELDRCVVGRLSPGAGPIGSSNLHPSPPRIMGHDSWLPLCGYQPHHGTAVWHHAHRWWCAYHGFRHQPCVHVGDVGDYYGIQTLEECICIFHGLCAPPCPPHVHDWLAHSPAGAQADAPLELARHDHHHGLGVVPERAGRLSSARMLRLGVLMAITMTLHNLPEGFAVAFSAFTDIGPIMALAIALHNIPEVKCGGAL